MLYLHFNQKFKKLSQILLKKEKKITNFGGF